VEYSVVVVVVAGTSSAQAPRRPTDIATAAAKATFFRSFILGLPRLGALFGSREPRFDSKHSTLVSGTAVRESNRTAAPATLICQTTPTSQRTRTITTTLPTEIGRYIRASCASLRSSCFEVGLAGGGQRRAGRATAELDQIRARYLYRSRPIHPTLGVM
jgi:hypothetical protein